VSEHKPSLDGPGLEPWVALILGDFSPEEYLKHLEPINRGSLTSANYYAPMHEAERCFRAASAATPDQAEESLKQMGKGKMRLRDAVGMFLEGRTCSCCIELRAMLWRKP